MCEYESPLHGGAPTRIEHWDVAFNHGKTAALNMLGKDVPHEEVPYFFSDLADWGGFEYVGPAYEWDEEILRGSMVDGSFTNWYLQDSVVKGALTVGRSDDLEHARRLIVDGSPLADGAKSRLADPSANLGGVLH
jgi:3-phenylpropionate/trans-cinnamate dioxygenase ferredoxin reductase subunit